MNDIEPGQVYRSTRPSEEGHTIEIVGLTSPHESKWLVKSLKTNRQYEILTRTLVERFERVTPPLPKAEPIAAPGL